MLTEQEKIHTDETSEVHKCHICEKVFSGKYGLTCLKRHLKTHSDVKEFLCDQCDYSTNVHFSLKIHKRNHTGRPYQCEKCAKAFLTQGELNKHLVIHSDKRLFQCDICGQDFKRSSILQRHKKLVHNINNKIQCHKCDECDESFSSKPSLIQHKGKHKKMPDFLCDTCSKPFFDHVSLTIHRQSHKDKKYKCPDCGKKFMEEKSLLRHIKEYHESDKDFSCDHCEKLLPTKYKLQVHMRKHKEKSYVCNICQKSFNRKENLKVHTLIHSGETPFKCTECYQEFRELFPLKKHMLRMHGIEYKPQNSPPCSDPPELSDPSLKKYYLHPHIPTPSFSKNMLEPSSGSSRLTQHLIHDELEGLSNLDSGFTHKFHLNIPSNSEPFLGNEKHYLEPPAPAPSPLKNLLGPSYNCSRSTPHLTHDELEGLSSLDSAITHKYNLNIPSNSEALSVKQILTSIIPCAKESLFSKLDNGKDSDLSMESKEDIVKIKVENIDAESIECNENAVDNENIKIEPVEDYEETAKIEIPTTAEAEVKIEKNSDIYMDSNLFKREFFYNDCDKMSNDINEDIKDNKNIIKISNEEHLYACNQCEYKSKFNYNIKKHIQQVHNNERRFMCDLCSKTYQTKASLQDHIVVVHKKTDKMSSEENAYACNQCEYKSKLNSYLKKHIKLVHNNEKTFMCDLCSKTYKIKISLRNHIELVHERNEIICDDCGRTFLSKINLRRHKRKVHSVNPPKIKHNMAEHNTTCDKSKLNLQHNSILRYACDQCDKKYKYSVSLKNHKLVHSGIETFNCDHCTEKFISKRTLVRHLNDSHNIQTHKKYFRQRPKTHMCQICSKYFRGISELERHQVVHTGERNHICYICNKAFSQQKAMKDHINQHLAGNLDSNGFGIMK